MGGKKQPRTKNNTQPSSSDRHAQRLGTDQLIGFSALSDLGYVPAPVGGAQDEGSSGAVSGQMRAVLKKMAKKDATTKSKATQEFTELCDSHSLDDVKLALPFWPRLYRKLATDVDNRVREMSHVALQRLLLRVRKAATPHMAELVPVWLCSQNDPYPPAATAARRAFQNVFSVPEKQSGAVKFCYSSVLAYVKEGLYDQTPQTYSDPSVMSVDELEARFVRLLTGCLSGLRELLELLPEDPEDARGASSDQPLADIVTHNKFVKLAKHSHPQVRRWWFCLVSRFCARRPGLVAAAGARTAGAW
ncbi:E3 ubiquitin-protein ligase listerin-like [Pollicipes pollicipes]|uniref:E3 ubiquitin-protein ligase listerin-like n=1 Tax=Pollicipes pollicipes TaxID=41117 RepID=UPI00188533E8|nr:E3 ubiquitin-protein ligase listerin-like [Pollicipes pollicipes]